MANASINPLSLSDVGRDAFRTLRMNVSFCGKDIKTLVVTSATPNDGKTTVSIGLAGSIAESMKNVLIIECDCRRPSVGNRLKLRPKKNWIDVIYNNATLEEAIVETSCKNLYFLDAEPGLVHSVELLSSGRFWEMVEELRKHFDMIIFDTPPLGAFSDAAVLASKADGTALVITYGAKDIRLIKNVIEDLKAAKANILGIVLDRVKAYKTSYYYKNGYYGYYYQYYYRKEYEGDKKHKHRHHHSSSAKKHGAYPRLSTDMSKIEEKERSAAVKAEKPEEGDSEK